MSTNIPANIWRRYDIRGLAPDDITPEIARLVGQGFGTLIQRLGGEKIVVARDARLTSPELGEALIEGILKTGCDVQDIGMAPTPVMYFTVAHFRYDAGIVVTASHNPPQYNGFKMRTRERPLFGDDIQELYSLVKAGGFERGIGRRTFFDAGAPYIEYISGGISLDQPLTVILDAGNGSAGPTAVALFERLGCQVIPLFCNPDGRFPNHIPDPTVPAHMEALRKHVLSTKVDAGIAFDGDGDRVAAMTPSGELLWGDRMLTVFCESVLASTGPSPIVFDVKCSSSLIEKIRQMGGTPVMASTGYPLIQAKMRETQAPLAGEMSGHMYFADRYYGYDDGIYAACRFGEILSQADHRFDDIVAALPHYPSTPELRLHCPDDIKFSIIGQISPKLGDKYKVITVDGLRFTTDSGWGLLRVSNTEPAIVARFEAKTAEELLEIISDALELLRDTSVESGPIVKEWQALRETLHAAPKL